MIRTVVLSMVCAVISIAQEKPANTLASLRETAQQKTAEWDVLAQDMEARIAHLLPCDPRVSGAIEGVSHASDDRLAALRRYWEADQARARSDAEAASRLIPGQDELKAELDAERVEAGQERAAIESLQVEVGESSKRRPLLEDARKALEGVAERTRQRGALAEAQTTAGDALGRAFAELGAALKTRQAALENEMRSLDAEIPHWREYYTARLTRAQAECAAINPPMPARRRPTRGKKQ